MSGDTFNYNHARLQFLIGLVERFMPFQKYGFRQSAQLFSGFKPDVAFGSREPRFPTVIYDSEYCRVKFLLDKELHGDQLAVYYSRLHAPDDERFMNWNDEDCYCWHSDIYNLTLKFLDGNSPKEAVGKRGKPPQGSQDFVSLGLQKTVEQPVFAVRFHAAAWEYYGKDLFELFDLRRPDLWKHYSHFIKEYYDLLALFSDIKPPLNQIC